MYLTSQSPGNQSQQGGASTINRSEKQKVAPAATGQDIVERIKKKKETLGSKGESI